MLDASSLEEMVRTVIVLATSYIPKVVLAVLTLLVGLWLIGMVGRGLRHALEARDFEATLRTFLLSLTNTLLKVVLGITVISILGVEATSLVAVLGAAGLAVGLALSGTLQNLAGGVVILIFRPFKVGDYLEAMGHAGTVSQIQIFNTILKTPDNKTVIVPNGNLSTSSMVNYSTEPTRRVDFLFGIGYGDDIDKARDIIRAVVDADERVHADPEPVIKVAALGESSVDLTTRVWTDSANYFAVLWDTTESVKKQFDAQGITIPFPQRDIHLHQA